MSRDAFFDAVHVNKANIAANRWTWKTDGRMYYLRRGADTVGTLSIIAGTVEHEAVLMDLITDHLNNKANP